MEKQFREKHLLSWTFLAFLLPAIIISGWFAVKLPATSIILLQPGPVEVFSLIIKSVTKENYTVSIRKNAKDSSMQLEWINNTAVTNPSALVYRLIPGKKENEIVGRIDAKGAYHFSLKTGLEENKHFILYDFIHQKVIDSINF